MPSRRRRSFVPVAALALALAAAPVGAKETARPTKALLVIDMQRMWVDKAPEKDFVRNVNRVIDATRGKVLTVYVVDDAGGPIVKGVHVVSPHRFRKSITDAYSNPKLVAFLERNGIREVVLVGLDAAYCVYATAMGAQARGQRVLGVADALSTRFSDHQTGIDRLVTLGVEMVKDEDI